MQPINHPKTLVEVTVNRIRDAIVSGELALGSKLSEQRLSDVLGVSRSPIHDALAVLQSEGLVNISPKRGSFVFSPDLRNVDELCELRAVLESAAIRMGIDRNGTALIRQLEKAIEVMQNKLALGDAHGYTVGDQQFHKAIIDSCDNRSMIRAYHQTISPVKALRTHLFTIMNARLDESMSEHIGIFNACRSRDAAVASALLEEHVGHLVIAFRTALTAKASADSRQSNG